MNKKRDHDNLPWMPKNSIAEHANWLEARNKLGFDMHEKDFSESRIALWLQQRAKGQVATNATATERRSRAAKVKRGPQKPRNISNE